MCDRRFGNSRSTIYRDIPRPAGSGIQGWATCRIVAPKCHRGLQMCDRRFGNSRSTIYRDIPRPAGSGIRPLKF